MRYQKRKQRAIKPLWGLAILLLGLVLSGWLSPAEADVTLCGVALSPGPHGIYRLRGVFECDEESRILDIVGVDGAYFDLRFFEAIGSTENTGIRIRDSQNVKIVGGVVKECKTGLEVRDSDGCKIMHLKAINSHDKAITVRGNDNTLFQCASFRAVNDGFEIRGENNYLEGCRSMDSGTEEEESQGFTFREPGSHIAKNCSAIGSSAEGFQIQEGTSDVTIEHCLAINNKGGGFVIKGATDSVEGASLNTLSYNTAFKNAGVGIKVEAYAEENEIFYNFALGNGTLDLKDDNDDCGSNTWYKNIAKTGEPPCTLER